jgi:hypothetical protein
MQVFPEYTILSLVGISLGFVTGLVEVNPNYQINGDGLSLLFCAGFVMISDNLS